MTLTITIDLDNAAFEDGGLDEIERLFASISSRLPQPLSPTPGWYSLHDANGNYCGEFGIVTDPKHLPPTMTQTIV